MQHWRQSEPVYANSNQPRRVQAAADRTIGGHPNAAAKTKEPLSTAKNQGAGSSRPWSAASFSFMAFR